MSIQSDHVSRWQNGIANFMKVYGDLCTLDDVAIARGYAAWTDGTEEEPDGPNDFEGIEINGVAMTTQDWQDMLFRWREIRAAMTNQAVGAMDRATVFNKYRADL